VLNGVPPSVATLVQMVTVMAPMSRAFSIKTTNVILTQNSSGTAAGSDYGVAKSANIIAVKVLSDQG